MQSKGRKTLGVLLGLIMLAALAPATPGMAITYTLYATDDVFAFEYYPWNYYGTGPMSTSTEARSPSNNRKNSYYKFNLSAIHDDYGITSAKLWLYETYASSPGVDIHHVDNDTWTEGGLCWGNKPGYDSDILISKTSMANYQYMWVQFDLLANGKWDYDDDLDDNYLSLMIKNSTETGGISQAIFRSKETTPYGSYTPYLQIEATPLPPAALLLGSGLLGLGLVGWRRKKSQ